MSRGTKKRSTFGILLDFILVLLTGGLFCYKLCLLHYLTIFTITIWLIWILIRYLRNNT